VPASRVSERPRVQQRFEVSWSVRSGSITQSQAATWLQQQHVPDGAMVRLVITCEASSVHIALRFHDQEFSLDERVIGDESTLQVRHQVDHVLGMQHLDVQSKSGMVLRATLASGRIVYAVTGAWQVLGVAGGRYEVEAAASE